MTKDRDVKVQLDPREDGLYSVTLKLIAYDLNELRAFASSLLLSVKGRRAGEQLAGALIADKQARDAAAMAPPEPAKKPRAQKKARTPQKAADGKSSPDVDTDTSEIADDGA